MTCGECRFYSFRSDECRRRAPQANGKEGAARWPSLSKHDRYEWCGEFEKDSLLSKYRAIVENPDKYASDRPWDMTEDETADWLNKQVVEAKSRIADLEDR